MLTLFFCIPKVFKLYLVSVVEAIALLLKCISMLEGVVEASG